MIEIIQSFLYQCALVFDLPILEWIRANLQSEFMDKFWHMITLFGEDGIFWIVLSVLFLIFPKTRKIGLGMALSMAIGLLICNVTLKPLIARPRPYDLQLSEFGKTIPLVIDGLHDFSFPSGHTIACFEASVVLMLNNKKIGIPALILAFLVAFSRLYLYVHYPTDVLVSMVLGTIIAFIGNAMANRAAPKLVKRGKFERA